MSEIDDAIIEQIRTALHEVIDPEIGFNIVDIGLIYDIQMGEGGVAKILMTTTTKGCPATDYLKEGSSEAAQSIEGVSYAEITLTYDPPWTPDMMTQVCKDYLGVG